MSSDDEKREAVQRIVSVSAEWGYRLAKSGHPFLRPSIVWDADGSFTITVSGPELLQPVEATIYEDLL